MAADDSTPANPEQEPSREELLRTIAELREENRALLRAVAGYSRQLYPMPEDFDAQAALEEARNEPSIYEILEELEREHGIVQPAPVQGHPVPGSHPRNEAAG